MAKEYSPYSKRIGIRDVAKIAGEYAKLTGRHIYQRLDCPKGMIILMYHSENGDRKLFAPMNNWKAYLLIEKMCAGIRLKQTTNLPLVVNGQ